MKKIILMLPFLFLIGCANVPTGDVIAKAEAGVGASMLAINEARAPCVDGDATNDAKCLINTDNFNKAVVSADAFDKAIAEAKRLEAVGLPQDAQTWITTALQSAATLTSIYAGITGATN